MVDFFHLCFDAAYKCFTFIFNLHNMYIESCKPKSFKISGDNFLCRVIILDFVISS